MLKRVNGKEILNNAGISGTGRLEMKEIPHIRIADAEFPSPFKSGLEYASPARGTWNIVHTGMLIPETHEVFVCASCCLRGVVLTAAEMGAMDRFSTVTIREHNLLDGDMEELVIEGVSDIIRKLPKRPPAILVYTSCVHHFTGVDLDMIYAELRERFPDIDFTDCYMNPIMRKSGMTPDQLMRSRLYTLLKEREINPRAVAIIGNDLPTDDDSELMHMLRSNDFTVREITSCRTYEEYQEMAESAYYISYYPDAAPGGNMLAERLGGRHFALKFSFDYDEIDETFAELAGALGINPRKPEDIADARRHCEDELAVTKELIGDTPISIDYTYCTRPLGLAVLLLTHGFNVKRVYLDAVSAGDKTAFEYLQKKFPELELCPTVHAGMRFAQTVNSTRVEEDLAQPRNGSLSHDTNGLIAVSRGRNANEDRRTDENRIVNENRSASIDKNERQNSKVRMLAIGQKAAYFENTNHFVNVVEGGGMIGYEAVYRTARMMREAYENEKPMEELVGIKGLGCEEICCSAC